MECRRCKTEATHEVTREMRGRTEVTRCCRAHASRLYALAVRVCDAAWLRSVAAV